MSKKSQIDVCVDVCKNEQDREACFGFCIEKAYNKKIKHPTVNIRIARKLESVKDSYAQKISQNEVSPTKPDVDLKARKKIFELNSKIQKKLAKNAHKNKMHIVPARVFDKAREQHNMIYQEKTQLSPEILEKSDDNISWIDQYTRKQENKNISDEKLDLEQEKSNFMKNQKRQQGFSRYKVKSSSKRTNKSNRSSKSTNKYKRSSNRTNKSKRPSKRTSKSKRPSNKTNKSKRSSKRSKR
jgi:hypothetical protein